MYILYKKGCSSGVTSTPVPHTTKITQPTTVVVIVTTMEADCEGAFHSPTLSVSKLRWLRKAITYGVCQNSYSHIGTYTNSLTR